MMRVASDAPVHINVRQPAKRATEPVRSGLKTTCPSLRASSRRRCVGASVPVFSCPAMSGRDLLSDEDQQLLNGAAHFRKENNESSQPCDEPQSHAVRHEIELRSSPHGDQNRQWRQTRSHFGTSCCGCATSSQKNHSRSTGTEQLSDDSSGGNRLPSRNRRWTAAQMREMIASAKLDVLPLPPRSGVTPSRAAMAWRIAARSSRVGLKPGLLRPICRWLFAVMPAGVTDSTRAIVVHPVCDSSGPG